MFLFERLTLHNLFIWAPHAPIWSCVESSLVLMKITKESLVSEESYLFFFLSSKVYLHLIVRLLFWRSDVWRTPSLLLLLGSFWPSVVVLTRDPSMGQIELFNHLPKIIGYLKPYKCVQIILLSRNTW